MRGDSTFLQNFLTSLNLIFKSWSTEKNSILSRFQACNRLVLSKPERYKVLKSYEKISGYVVGLAQNLESKQNRVYVEKLLQN